MRNPAISVTKIPGMLESGKVVFQLLSKTAQHETVQDLVKCVLKGKPAKPISPKLLSKVRELMVKITGCERLLLPTKTAKASTPISADIIKTWGHLSGDHDLDTLATWLRQGAPLGFTEKIPNNGIFPRVAAVDWDSNLAEQYRRNFQGWENHPSASEWESELLKLVGDSIDKGFCFLYSSTQEAFEDLGIEPVLNKLGVIVKDKVTPSGVTRKSKIIWDMRESHINSSCSQGGRIILPKVTDVISDAIDIFPAGGTPSFVAVDIRDAFHNIPAGRDRAFTAAAINTQEGKRVLVYDVLVFGSVSSPTLWGRFASWLSRSWAAINSEIQVQTYADDPIMTFDSSNPNQRNLLGVQLLWAAVAGFPIKLEKSDAGEEVKWIGALLRIDNDNKCVVVTIPAEKVTELKQEIRKANLSLEERNFNRLQGLFPS